MGSMLGNVKELGEQISKSLKTSNIEKIKTNSNLVVVGMGGSGVAGDALRIFAEEKGITVDVIKDYSIPKILINKEPHCLLISYSGNTEETLYAFNQVSELGLACTIVTSGGQLKEEAIGGEFPLIEIPSGYQPRAAFGFLLRAMMEFLDAFERSEENVNKCNEAKSFIDSLLDDEGNVFKRTKDLSSIIGRRTLLIYAGTPVTKVAAGRLKTQINENAKSQAFIGELPEIHHNEIFAWEGDKENSLNNFIVLFMRDINEHPQVSKRINLTKKVLEGKAHFLEDVTTKEESTLNQLLELVLYGDLISVYVAELLNMVPEDIKIIEQVKELLKD